jgi:transposase
MNGYVARHISILWNGLRVSRPPQWTIKLLWHDGVGMCLFIKRLERGQYIWPMSSAGTVSLTPGQLSTLLEGCEWRATARNLRPELAG